MNFLMVFSPTKVRPVMIDLTAVLTSGGAFFISGTATLKSYLGKRKRESGLYGFYCVNTGFKKPELRVAFGYSPNNYRLCPS